MAEYRWLTRLDASGDYPWDHAIGGTDVPATATVEDANPEQVDSATATHAQPTPHVATATDENPQQSDSAGVTHEAPQQAAATAEDANPQQVDDSGATHEEPPEHFPTVEEGNPEQSDAATATQNLVSFIGDAEDANPAQSDTIAASHVGPIPEGAIFSIWDDAGAEWVEWPASIVSPLPRPAPAVHHRSDGSVGTITVRSLFDQDTDRPRGWRTRFGFLTNAEALELRDQLRLPGYRRVGGALVGGNILVAVDPQSIAVTPGALEDMWAVECEIRERKP